MPSRALAFWATAAALVLYACTTDTAIGPSRAVSLYVTPVADTMVVGDSVQLHAVAVDQHGVAFVAPGATWASQNPAIATVSDQGVVTGIAPGMTMVAATLQGLSATAQVVVTPRPVIAPSADSVGFTAVANGPAPAAQQITITNTGGGTLTGLAVDSVSYAGTGGWLSAGLSGATAPATLTLQTTTTGLAIATYTATVFLSAPQASNTPKGIKVTYAVGVGAAASIAADSGDGQTAQVNTAVPVRPVVIVRDQYGNPVPGVSVTFAVTGGGGVVDPTTAVTTDVNGRARALSWTLGTAAGANSLSAASGVLTGSPVSFSATGVAGPAAQVIKQAGDGQTAVVNTAVAIPPAAKVTDQFGNPVSGVSVTFAVTAGGGSVTGASATSAANGIATVGSWTLGTTAGTNTLSASSGGLTGSPLTFTATGVANSGAVSATASTVIASAASMTACRTSCSVAAATADSVIVTVRDTFNNLVSGVIVTPSCPAAAACVFAPASGTTDAGGVFVAILTDTLSGAKTVSANAGGTAVTQTASVTVNAAAVSLANSLVSAGTATITACKTSCVAGTTAATITVTVRDAFSNVIGGAGVTPSCSVGAACAFSPASGTTNGSGVFATAFADTVAGGKTIQAAVTSVGTITQTASVTVNAAAPATVAVTSGNGQTARVGTGVATRPTWTVRDAFGNLVTGQAVTISSGGGGAPSPTSGTTNGSGQFTLTSWALGGTGTETGATLGGLLNTATLTAGSATGTATDTAFYTYSLDVGPIIGTGSGCDGCHYVSWTYANIVNQLQQDVTGYTSCTTANSADTLAQAGHAASSLIYLKVAGLAGCGSTMPPPSGGLTATQLQIIRTWINRNALNN